MRSSEWQLLVGMIMMAILYSTTIRDTTDDSFFAVKIEDSSIKSVRTYPPTTNEIIFSDGMNYSSFHNAAGTYIVGISGDGSTDSYITLHGIKDGPSDGEIRYVLMGDNCITYLIYHDATNSWRYITKSINEEVAK